jgi:hypothetical protein
MRAIRSDESDPFFLLMIGSLFFICDWWPFSSRRQVFSSHVITPGQTTTDDVSWAITDRIQALGCMSTFKHR